MVRLILLVAFPLTVDFKDTVRNATSYEWNFGDGSPNVFTKDFDIQHTYNLVGRL